MTAETFHAPEVYLKQIADDIRIVKGSLTKILNAIHDAESEVPEKVRRFVMYMHDMHDIKNLFVEHGLEVPAYIMREMERCDDRLRQIIEEAHTDGGAFEKVRREMAKDANNRWDHTRALAGPKGECQ